MFAIVVVIVVFILNLLWYRYRRRRFDGTTTKNSIPGVAPSDRKLGNLGDIGRAGSLHQFLTQLHRKFGPVTWFSWGDIPVISIASPQAFHDTRRLFDRPVPLFAAFEPLIGPNSIQYANGDVGRYRRKHHYDAALSSVALRNDFYEIFREVLQEKLRTWQSDDNEQPIALHQQMLAMAIRSITLAAFGTSVSSDDCQRLEQAYNVCWEEMEMRIQGRTMNEQRELAFNQARDVLLDQVKLIVQQRRERVDPDRKCFIDYLLDDQEHLPTEAHICDEVITMFVGGFHTTGNLLTWTLYYLAKHNEIQERLVEELERTYQTDFPSFEQIEEMTYLTNVINESLRLSVLAPWAARVSTDESLKICGYDVPPGTPIIQALGVVLTDEEVWTNAKEFRPDRFEQENKKNLPILAYSPFGFAGKRICPGYRFAQYETSLFISGIIKRFQVTLVNPTKPAIPVYRLVTSPKHEIYVRFHRRS